MNKAEVTIEQGKRFSQSCIWDAQRAYYDEKGIDAWAGSVPFYITSNPFIANCYARVLIRFIQDWVAQNPESRHEPFYITELGTGSGQFSFYVLRRLVEVQKMLGLDDIKIRYVMTDFTMSNVKFWEQHEALQPFIEAGILDFAVFDVERGESLDLTLSKKTITKDSLKNPIIVFANYLFDSLVSDTFTVKDGEIKEALTRLTTPEKNYPNGKVNDWKKVKINYDDVSIERPYYQEEHFDDVLFQYPKLLKETCIDFPVGALRGLSHLKALSSGKMLLVSSDKGYMVEEELESLDYPELDFHGSFSTMVNFHAIESFVKACDGEAYLPTPRDALVTAVFSTGFSLKKMPELSRVIYDWIEGFSPNDYFNFYDQLSEQQKKLSLSMLGSYLAFSLWDPFLYDEICDCVIDLIDGDDEQVEEYLAAHMHKIAENFYYIPETQDTIFNIALFFHELEQFDKARHYYVLSEKHFGRNYATVYNIAFCDYYLENSDAAFKGFKEALELKPNSKDAKEWVAKMKKSMSEV